ncbi:MAG: hypothetical protein OEQ53_04435 [Saprospiraceae bacterium]|nr:hypothetical protein [Saprospiraceae bacterium]
MFRILLTGVLSSLALCTLAQVQQLGTSVFRIEAEVNLLEDHFNATEQPGQQGTMLRNVQTAWEKSDLVIDYELPRSEDEQYYQVSLEVSLDGNKLLIHPDDLLGDVGSIVNNPVAARQIIWTRLLDRYGQLAGNLSIELTAVFWGKPSLPFGVDCANMPTFSGKQKLMHYVIAGVGAATLGASFVVGNEAQDIYDNQYLAESFEQAAEPFYQDANDKRHQELVLRYAGITLLSLDAIWYVYRSIRYRQKLRTFEEFCGDSVVRINPFYKSNYTDQGSQMGLKLTYRF